ncbi:MAG: T9SS C-terminal target domain-containing protein [Ignavibacteriae bacterium]|nr:MAG: T9SS C-terminal target domain-containing protein [Ignavibacteriota bacterium]
MKKLILLSLLFSAIVSLNTLYSQPASQLANDNTPFIKGNEGMLGAQCVGGLVYDDNTWENGYGWNAGYGIGKWAMKMTPADYPFTINQVCLALTRVAAGSANFTFDIVFYDATGTGGGPGTLVHTIANQTATGVPIWPNVTWFDFTGLTGVPPLTTGQSYYVGISYDPATMPSHYIAADESPTTILRPGYGYIQSAWAGIQTYYPNYKAIGVRCDGTGVTYTHNIATGPFLSLPGLYNVNVQKVIKAKVKNLGTSNESNIPMKFFVNGTQVNSLIITSLNANAVDSVAFNWTPADTGNFILKIVSALVTDEYRANDTVSTIVHVYPPGYYSPCYGTGSIAVQYPFYTFYMDSRTDFLYLASEIGVNLSVITKIGFTVLSAAPQVMNGFKIKMQNTPLTSLTGFVSTGWTEVYSGTYSVSSTGLQWIYLSTPFYYNSNCNLLIEICFNNSSYTSSTTIASTSNPNRVFHNHQDISAGDGCVMITAGTVQATLPNICFQGYPTNLNPNPPCMVGVNGTQNEIPKEFSLSQNYPNPFNPKTIISYQLPVSSEVKLVIYDALGKVVAALVNEKQTPGTYDVEWDGTNFASGLYFLKIECDGFTDVKKIMLLK